MAHAGPRQPVLRYLLELLEKAVCFCFCFCFLSCLRLRPAQATPPSGYSVYSRRTTIRISKGCLHPTFTTAKTQKQARCPLTDGAEKEEHMYSGILQPWEGRNLICDSMDELGGH